MGVMNEQVLGQACSQEFAQGGSDFIECKKATPTFFFFVYSLKSGKEGGKLIICLTFYVFY